MKQSERLRKNILKLAHQLQEQTLSPQDAKNQLMRLAKSVEAVTFELGDVNVWYVTLTLPNGKRQKFNINNPREAQSARQLMISQGIKEIRMEVAPFKTIKELEWAEERGFVESEWTRRLFKASTTKRAAKEILHNGYLQYVMIPRGNGDYDHYNVNDPRQEAEAKEAMAQLDIDELPIYAIPYDNFNDAENAGWDGQVKTYRKLRASTTKRAQWVTAATNGYSVVIVEYTSTDESISAGEEAMSRFVERDTFQTLEEAVDAALDGLNFHCKGTFTSVGNRGEAAFESRDNRNMRTGIIEEYSLFITKADHQKLKDSEVNYIKVSLRNKGWL